MGRQVDLEEMINEVENEGNKTAKEGAGAKGEELLEGSRLQVLQPKLSRLEILLESQPEYISFSTEGLHAQVICPTPRELHAPE